jgi:DUF4097 and DUF4098 domain-containing protein YvlB
VTVGAEPTLVIDAEGEVRVVTGAAGTIAVTGELEPKGGRKVAVTRSGGFKLAGDALGASLSTRYPTGTFNLKLTVEVPPRTRIVVKSLAGRLETEGTDGPFEAKLKYAALVLKRHAGSINVSLKNGRVDVEEFSGEGEAVTIRVKDGAVAVSVTARKPGAATIAVGRGSASLSATETSKLTVNATIVEAGRVRVTPEFTQPLPNAAYFTLNGGGTAWFLKVDNGDIRLNFAEPTKK